jgi:hypothetical protein
MYTNIPTTVPKLPLTAAVAAVQSNDAVIIIISITQSSYSINANDPAPH